MLRSTRRLILIITLCFGLGLSFIAVANAGSGARGEAGPADEAAPSAQPERPAHAQAASAEAPEDEEQEAGSGETPSDQAQPTETPPAETEPQEGEAGAEGEAESDEAEEGGEGGEGGVAGAEAEAKEEAAPDGPLDLEVTGGETLVQVGGSVTYGIVVSNPGEDPLRDVVVQALLAPELDLVDAPGADVAGSSVTWTFPVLTPDGTQSLALDARVAREGDLRALTEVSALASDVADPSEETLETFIGAARGASVSNPEPRVFEEITVMRPREVVVRVDDQVLGRTILPVTGVPVGLLVAAGLLLISLGSLILGRARGSVRVTSARLLVVCLLVFAACTPDVDEGPEQAAPDTPAPATSPTEPESDDDEVLGTVVEPEEADEDEDGDGTGQDDGAPAAGEPSDEVAPPPVVQTITVQEEVVRRRLLDVDEIPIRTLGTTPGANAISLEWTGSDIDTAASSISFDPAALAEVTTGLGASNGAVDAEVTLRNLLSDQRLAVRGRFVHEITGPGGFNAVLRSETIDMILNPDGTTTYRFTYALPAGDYGLTSRFEANG